MDQFRAMWDQMRQKYGIYLRVLESIPGDRFHARPVPGMRSPAQMVAHVSGSLLVGITEGVLKGEIEPREEGEDAVAERLGSRSDVLAFARECWQKADDAAAQVTPEHLERMVPTPWNMTFPGHVAFQVLHDEFLHHRGQLYAYARVLGAEPPFLWGFQDNPEGFRPAARA